MSLLRRKSRGFCRWSRPVKPDRKMILWALIMTYKCATAAQSTADPSVTLQPPTSAHQIDNSRKVVWTEMGFSFAFVMWRAPWNRAVRLSVRQTAVWKVTEEASRAGWDKVSDSAGRLLNYRKSVCRVPGSEAVCIDQHQVKQVFLTGDFQCFQCILLKQSSFVSLWRIQLDSCTSARSDKQSTAYCSDWTDTQLSCQVLCHVTY